MKWIEGFEGLYSIEENGNVTSHKVGVGTYGKPTVLKPQPVTKGYMQVVLFLEGKKKNARVHRLVAQAFLPNPNNLPQINHLDKNKKNNHLSNLEWCTNQENCEHALAKHYRIVHKTGAVAEIYNMNQWCRDQGLCSSSMGRVLNGSRKTYRGWMLGE